MRKFCSLFFVLCSMLIVVSILYAEQQGNITLDFKDADIQSVLRILSEKGNVNIVTGRDVVGTVTMRLVDVPWEKALDVILKTYGYGYERQGNIFMVMKLENITKVQAEEPLKTEIFTLKFLDAPDAQKVIIPLLSSRGRVSVLYTKGQKGWQFGTFKIGKEGESAKAPTREKEESEKSEVFAIEKITEAGISKTVAMKLEFPPSVKSKTLIVTDTAAALEDIRNLLQRIDKKPKQVLIETRIMEVNRDKLKDLGVDWGTGTTGAESTTMGTINLKKTTDLRPSEVAGAHNLGTQVTPSLFTPKTTGLTPTNTGLKLLYQKLTGNQFEVILHALEEDAHTNTLSAPRILTLDNQEAAILVGYHRPILKSTVTAGSTSTGTGTTITQDLDYYQEIGIRLNVVPQVNEEGYINMLIHPSVTSSTSSVTATSTASGETTSTDYPIIDVREAQTQVLMRDGETIVLGGLLKDIKSKQVLGVPILSKIPLLGLLFKRETIDTAKVDLLIFISAHILKEDEFSPEEIAKLEKELGTEKTVAIKKKQ